MAISAAIATAIPLSPGSKAIPATILLPFCNLKSRNSVILEDAIPPKKLHLRFAQRKLRNAPPFCLVVLESPRGHRVFGKLFGEHKTFRLLGCLETARNPHKLEGKGSQGWSHA